MAREDDLALVAKCLRRARAVVGGLVAAALASAVVTAWVWAAGYFGAQPAGHFFGAVLCASLLLVAYKGALLFQARAAIGSSTVYRLLRDQPRRVLWVFPTALRTTILGATIEAEQIIVLCTEDGKIERIRGVAKKDLKEVMAAVRRLLPQAYFGLTDKNRRRYQQATGFLVK